jgi:hypothetical protein
VTNFAHLLVFLYILLCYYRLVCTEDLPVYDDYLIFLSYKLFFVCVQSMREGVIKDIQRQEMKKIQNLKLLQDQIELAKALKEQQAYEQLSNRYHAIM